MCVVANFRNDTPCVVAEFRKGTLCLRVLLYYYILIFNTLHYLGRDPCLCFGYKKFGLHALKHVQTRRDVSLRKFATTHCVSSREFARKRNVSLRTLATTHCRCELSQRHTVFAKFRNDTRCGIAKFSSDTY